MNIRIGDTILSRFGEGKVIHMLLSERVGGHDGESVSVVGIESVFAGKVIFDLDNGKWVYSDQVYAINHVSMKRLKEAA